MSRHEELPHLEPGHWNKVPGAHSEQTYEFAAYRTEIVANKPGWDEVERQLRHAQEQQRLARMYPGRRISRKD
jgi:hypothetical protein